MWAAIIRINTEGKSFIMKLGPAGVFNCENTHWVCYLSHDSWYISNCYL